MDAPDLPARGRFALTSAAVFVAILAAFWLAVLFLGMGFMPGEYAMWSARMGMVRACDFAPTVVQGDSRAAVAFVPARLPGTTNVALGGSTPVEASYVADALLRCARPPRRVVLYFSPPQLMVSTYFWDRSALFGLLGYDQLEEIRRWSRRLNDPLLYAPARFGDLDAKLDDAVHAVRFPSYYSSMIVKHFGIGRLAENRRIAADTLAARGQHGYGSDPGSHEIADEARMESFRPSPLYTLYFERLLESYARRHTRVFFVAPPFNRSTALRIRPEVLAAYRAYLSRLAARHANFTVVGLPASSMDDAFFGDSTHLNARGAAVFSDGVRATLAQIGE